MEKVLVLKLENGMTFEARAEESLGLKEGSLCVFNRDFYTDIGEVTAIRDTPSMTANIGELPAVLREAANSDLAAANANLSKGRSAMNTALQWVETLKLPMKLVNAHYSVDGKLVTIQFCSDGRVDFRELVKELSRALSSRIELRQIGVRDETAIYGGIGVCGQSLCCCRFLHEFSSINVKMAKTQDLALTPGTISGICGRLKCCLKYEHEGYLELERDMPRKGEFCETPAGIGRVSDRNLLTRRVTVTLEGGSTQSFDRSEVTILPPERRPSGNAQRESSRKRGGESAGAENRERKGRSGNGARRERRTDVEDKAPQTPSAAAEELPPTQDHAE